MSKKLSKALHTDLNEMAALLRSKGRGRDTILAHINPEEAALLKRRGGSGTINPETGIMEFEDGSFDWFSPSTWFGGGGEAPAPAEAPAEAPAPAAAPVDMTQYQSDPNYQEALTGQYPTAEAPQYFNVDTATGSYGPSGELLGTWNPQLAAYADPTRVNQETALASYGPQGQIQGLYDPAQGMYSNDPRFQIGAGALQDVTGGGGGGLTDQQKKELSDKGVDWTKLGTSTLQSLLGTAGKFGLGYAMTKPIQRTQTKAAQESAAMGEKIGALGAPTKAVGTQQLAQAEAGQLTPVQRRNLQALRAQQRQAMSRAGITSGTAALQGEVNVQRLANEYTQSNIENALKMIQFGDRYVAQGIRAGYDANQQANQAANVFYQNLFNLLGGTANPMRG